MKAERAERHLYWSEGVSEDAACDLPALESVESVESDTSTSESLAANTTASKSMANNISSSSEGEPRVDPGFSKLPGGVFKPLLSLAGSLY